MFFHFTIYSINQFYFLNNLCRQTCLSNLFCFIFVFMVTNSVRDKIVSVAGRLFYEQGYNNTGINQVIDEAGIAKASLYNHFNSKTDLLIAYLNSFGENWFAGADRLLSTINDPKQKLLALFDYRINNQRKANYGGCAFIKISAEVEPDETEIFELVQGFKQRLQKYIHALVVKANESKILTDEMLTDTAYLLMEGGLSAAAIFKHTKDLEKGKKILKTLL